MRRVIPWIAICLLALFCLTLIRALNHQIDEAAYDKAQFAASRAETARLDQEHFELFVQYVQANELLIKENRALAAEALKHPARDFRDF